MQPVTTVSAGQAPRRLDVFVSTQTAHLSRAVVQRWIDGGLMLDLTRLNAVTVDATHRRARVPLTGCSSTRNSGSSSIRLRPSVCGCPSTSAFISSSVMRNPA